MSPGPPTENAKHSEAEMREKPTSSCLLLASIVAISTLLWPFERARHPDDTNRQTTNMRSNSRWLKGRGQYSLLKGFAVTKWNPTSVLNLFNILYIKVSISELDAKKLEPEVLFTLSLSGSYLNKQEQRLGFPKPSKSTTQYCTFMPTPIDFIFHLLICLPPFYNFVTITAQSVRLSLLWRWWWSQYARLSTYVCVLLWPVNLRDVSIFSSSIEKILENSKIRPFAGIYNDSET